MKVLVGEVRSMTTTYVLTQGFGGVIVLKGAKERLTITVTNPKLFLMAQVSHIKEAFRFFENERISEMSKNIKEASMQQSA